MVWVYLYSKYVFWEKEWAIIPTTPLMGESRRRINVTVKNLAVDDKLAVLTFHEAKTLNADP